MPENTCQGKACSNDELKACSNDELNVLAVDYDGCIADLIAIFIDGTFENTHLKRLREPYQCALREETLQVLSHTPTKDGKTKPFDLIIPASLRVSRTSDLWHQHIYKTKVGLPEIDCRLFSGDLTTLEELLKKNGVESLRIDQTTILDIYNALLTKKDITTLEPKALKEKKESDRDITVDGSKTFMWTLQAWWLRKKYPEKNIHLYIYDDSLRDQITPHPVRLGAKRLNNHRSLLPQGVTVHFHTLDGYQLFNEGNEHKKTRNYERPTRSDGDIKVTAQVLAKLLKENWVVSGTRHDLPDEMLKKIAQAALPTKTERRCEKEFKQFQDSLLTELKDRTNTKAAPNDDRAIRKFVATSHVKNFFEQALANVLEKNAETSTSPIKLKTK